MAFTARSFRKHISKKSRASRKSRKTRNSKNTRKSAKSQKGGGDTLDRSIPKGAVITNPIDWDDRRE